MIDRLLALISFVPDGLDRLARTAMPALRGRSVVVPVALGLLLLATVPVIQAALDLVTTRTVPSEVIGRDVGDATRLEVVGQAFDTGLAAGTDADGTALRWLALRDDAGDRAMLMVRTPVSPTMLRTRKVVARVVVDADLVGAASEALALRGAAPPVADVPDRYLLETRDAPDPRAIDGPAQIADLADGTVVRLELRQTSSGIASCTLTATCDARAMAAGTGRWLVRAEGPADDASVLLETALPPSAIPVDLYGTQARRQPDVQAFATTEPAALLLGWGRVFDITLLDHDPKLPVDRFWVGVLGLAGTGLLLLVARRRPYPIFRHEAPAAGWIHRATVTEVRGSASGRLAVGENALVDATDLPVQFVAAAPGGMPTVQVHLPAGPVAIDVPVASTGVRGLEHGRMAWITISRPALWLHWYRTDVRVAFASEDDRDAAAAVLAGIAEPPPPPTMSPPAIARPPRRPSADDGSSEPPASWRRPRPRGIR